jgi:PKD repeat protein
MTGLTGIFSAYNGVTYTFNYPGYITITLPVGNVGGLGTATSFVTSAAVTGVTGVAANMSNLFSPSANVITGMGGNGLEKYRLVGDVATLEYSCNVIGLYGAIGAVANVTSTLIPEVYSLIPGTGSDGTISIIRNIY